MAMWRTWKKYLKNLKIRFNKYFIRVWIKIILEMKHIVFIPFFS